MSLPRELQLLIYDIMDARMRLSSALQRASDGAVYAVMTDGEREALSSGFAALTSLERSLHSAETQLQLPIKAVNEGWSPSPYLVGKRTHRGDTGRRREGGE